MWITLTNQLIAEKSVATILDQREYHLGCGQTRDEDRTLVAYPRKYVKKILESYEKMFGSKPKKTRTQPMAGDHPENDLSEFCDQDQIKQYQTIVGQLIWLSGWGDLTLQYIS